MYQITIAIDRTRGDTCEVSAQTSAGRELVSITGVTVAMIEETSALVAKRVGIELAKVLAEQLGVGA